MATASEAINDTMYATASEGAPPVLDAVIPEIVPDPRVGRGGEPTYPLSAAEFERLFGGTPLRLEHGPFLEFLRPEIEEARSVARQAAGSGELVVLYSY